MRRTAHFVHAISAVIAVTFFSAVAAVPDSITITVNPGPQQKFGGLGFSLADQTLLGWPADTASQKTFMHNMIRESKFRNIALWGNGWMSPSSSTASDTTSIGFRTNVFNMVKYAEQAGVDFIMITPISDRPLATHVRFWARAAKMWRNHGVNLNVLTFLNKPNTGQNGRADSGKKRREPSEVVAGVKLLRKTLDSLGMQDAKVCSPSVVEWHPEEWMNYGDIYDFTYGDTLTYMNALTADAEAMNSIAAIDMQVYGTGIGNWARDIAFSHNKEMWVGFSATDAPQEWDPVLPDGKNCILNGPITAGTCLSDLNHGVSRWCFWLLYNLVKNASATAPEYFVRYHYMSAISNGFDRDAVFRQCTAVRPRQGPPDMRWNYELSDPATEVDLQPDIIATAALNPDSTWTVGIVNLSSIRSQHKASDENGTARTYRTTVNIPELQSVPTLEFTARKCDDITGIKDGGMVTMQNGSMTFSINTRELLVLRSGKVSPVALQRGILAHSLPGCRVRETEPRIFRAEPTGGNAAPVHITVLSPNGTAVTGAGSDGRTVDLRSASRGFYLVQVTTGGRTAAVRVVVR